MAALSIKGATSILSALRAAGAHPRSFCPDPLTLSLRGHVEPQRGEAKDTPHPPETGVREGAVVMRCGICGYQAHEGCCEGCIGHTTDGQCVTVELLDEWEETVQ